jgi:transmembrane protein EpsG
LSIYLSVIALIGFLWFMHASGPGLAAARGTSGRDGLLERRSVPRWLAVAAGAALAAVGALRWQVGVDYNTYAGAYPLFRDTNWDEMSVAKEPGLRVLAKMAAVLYDDYATMFAIASVITLVLCVRTLHKYSQAFFLSLMLFVLTGAWQGTFNGMRQWLACAIIFAGHRFILERRFVPFALAVMLASLFHVSAVLLVLLYFVPRRRLGLGRGTLLIIAVVAAAQSYDLLAQGVELLRDDITGLTRSGYFNEQVNPLRVLSALGPPILYLVFTDRDRLSDSSRFYINVAFVHAAITAAAFDSAYITRFTAYTLPFVALAIPAMLNMERRLLKGLLIGITLGLYAVTWYLDTSYSSYTATFRWVFER